MSKMYFTGLWKFECQGWQALEFGLNDEIVRNPKMTLGLLVEIELDNAKV